MSEWEDWCKPGDHWVDRDFMRFTKGRYTNTCLACHAKREKARRKSDPRAQRDRWLRRRYGITVETYEHMHQAQGGLCGICQQPETKVLNGTPCMLAVDHDHTTSRVRGLLCSRCNPGIGYLMHDIDRLHAAIAYLEATS